MMRYGDNDAFLKLDNALVLQFLTGAVSALAERGRVDSAQLEGFRLLVSELQKPEQSVKNWPLLTYLHEQRDDVVEGLLLRFGTTNLCRSITRYQVVDQFQNTKQVLAQLGETLLSKAQSVFNRQFSIRMGDQLVHTVLFSTALIDVAEAVGRCVLDIERASSELGKLLPSGFGNADPEEAYVDQCISENLSMAKPIEEGLPNLAENIVKFTVCSALQQLAATILVFAEQLRGNLKKDSTAKLMVSCENLRAEIHHLQDLNLQYHNDLDGLELKRLRLLKTIVMVNDSLAAMEPNIVEALRGVTALSTNTTFQLTETMKRTIGHASLKMGIDARKARQGAEAFSKYCLDNLINPGQVIPAELAKVDANLTIEGLEWIQKLEQDQSLATHRTTEKAHNLARFDKLKETFQRLVSTTVLVLCIAPWLTGCGVKGNPVSDVLNPRPEIPFRTVNKAPEIEKGPQSGENKSSADSEPEHQ